MSSIMKRKEVLEVTGMCYTSIYNKMKLGQFPSSKKLGERSVGWLRSEVQAWLDKLQAVYPVDVLAMPIKQTALPVDPLSLLEI